ncbi:MAG: Spx/MgsR family RNA polymerase-binding regulatory protein [Acholeplasmataceae bacterium]|jgi:regulatory protein spx|nr:Spx/MgsR family RNA polymerase-binding regulatory protein [Acholeplasmataceae bacterium]
MITIFTTPSCSSCRKAKKWLDEHKIPYEEKNLFNQRITESDIDRMLENAENGFEDIISTRSKIFKEQDLDVEDMKISELKEFIIDNPSVLKRPIIIDGEKLQVGYNDEEIRVFIPKRLRELIMCTDCPNGEYCDYQSALKRYFDEIKKDLHAEQKKELV